MVKKLIFSALAVFALTSNASANDCNRVELHNHVKNANFRGIEYIGKAKIIIVVDDNRPAGRQFTD